MTQVVSPESVFGNFDGETLTLLDHRFTLSRDGEMFWAEIERPGRSGEKSAPIRLKRQIALVTGSHHIQAYWYATGSTRCWGSFPLFFCGRSNEGYRETQPF
jgi:hypothetical protein